MSGGRWGSWLLGGAHAGLGGLPRHDLDPSGCLGRRPVQLGAAPRERASACCCPWRRPGATGLPLSRGRLAPQRRPGAGVASGRAVAVGDDVLEGAAAGDHGQHVLDVGHHDVQQVGAGGVQHLTDGGAQLLQRRGRGEEGGREGRRGGRVGGWWQGSWLGGPDPLALAPSSRLLHASSAHRCTCLASHPPQLPSQPAPSRPALLLAASTRTGGPSRRHSRSGAPRAWRGRQSRQPSGQSLGRCPSRPWSRTTRRPWEKKKGQNVSNYNNRVCMAVLKDQSSTGRLHPSGAHKPLAPLNSLTSCPGRCVRGCACRSGPPTVPPSPGAGCSG